QLVLAKGDRAEAMAHIERALVLDPNHIYALRLKRKLKSEAEPSVDQVDDWSQIPDVLSELSTFPTMEIGRESFEWEPEEQLVEISKEQPRSVEEPTPENEIQPQTEAATELETEAATELETEAATQLETKTETIAELGHEAA